MNSVKVPVPGIVLGEYPERRDVKRPAALWVALRMLGGRLHKPRLTRYRRFALRVAAFTAALDGASMERLQTQTHALRARIARDGFVDDILVEAFALVAEIARRELGIAPYATQLIAARIMLDNQLAEMATGEGKTLAAAIAAAVAALAGVPVHVVTANDYLVERDAGTLLPLYRALALDVGTVTQGMDAAARKAAYACNVTYCTAKELVFDYLRDGLTEPRRGEFEQRVARLNAPNGPNGPNGPKTLLRGLCMAIIDEADSILIDEARVPLVLSRAVPAGNDLVNSQQAWDLSAQFGRQQHFSLDPATRKIDLTPDGRTLLSRAVAAAPTCWSSIRHCEDAVKTALFARHVLQRDRDYLVRQGKVCIIDETSGRTAAGRAWSRGLHQMVEAKEDCPPTPPTTPVTQITYQRFFPRYLRLGGMSGTLLEAQTELLQVYGLAVTPVMLRLPGQRRLLPPSACATRQDLWEHAVARIKTLHAAGRPVLIGTDSVADSEELSRHLHAAALTHTVLNARQDQAEARIIATAGKPAAISVATNMAGRGTDIRVSPEVARKGGLHVISCQQNSSRRIDRQLIGRCARQGDPGSAEIFISLEGRLLASHWAGAVARELSRTLRWQSGRVGLVALRLAQWSEERHQRHERKMQFKKDKEMAGWLAFSGQER